MKKLFTLLMTLWLAIGSLLAVNLKGGEVLYLTPCDNWINNAKNNGGGKPGRYAAYFFNNSPKAEAWVAMTQVEGEFYQVTAPSGNFTNVIFCSMNPGSIGLSWNDKWNQTGDLSYDGTKNHYTVKAGTWDKGGGSWSTYTPPTPDPVITVAAAPEFATTTVGETSSATLKYTLENATEATATIEGEGFSISAQAVGSVTIAFAPEAEGDYTGTLTITSGEVKETVALAAKAVAAEAPKVPEFLNVTTPVFAEIIEGEVTTAEVKYELVNATEATASVDGEFFSIKEQELGKVIIEFASEEAGVFEGTLTLTSGETVKEITFTATAKKAPVVITISFVNPDWTEAAIWAWVEGGENLTGGTWPGKAMTKDETTGIFSYALTIPEDGVYSFIINNNNNGLQSVDMTGVTESTCYNLGAKSGEKYNLVVAENCDYTPAPEPEPIDPYVAIRGTMTNWDMANDIKMTYNADAANGPEWYITAFEVPADGKFKVVSVDDKSQATWYGSDKVDLQEGITNAGQGDGDIALPAGKYDIYFKVNEGSIWIQKYVAPEEPKPSLTVSTEEVVFDEVELGEEPVVVTETITYTVENSEEAVVLALESDVFTAEDAEGTITITFAPTSEGEYTAELTLTLGDIVKTIAISGAAKAAEIVDPEEPKINIIVSDFERNTAEVGDETDAAVVYSLENIESAEVEIEGEYVTFLQEEVEEGFMIAVFFRPEEVGEFPGKLTITAGEVSEEIEFTFIATELEEEPEYPKTITVKVACAWEACNIWAWYADGSGNVYTEWPGEAMTKGEDGFYAIDMTIESPVYFKVNAGLGKTESDNYMTELSESTCFNMDGLTLVVNEDCEYEEPIEIEPYYGIRGLVSWEMADDIKLTEDADKAEWYITNVEVDGTQEFKVVYVDETGAATWFGSEAVELQEGVVNNGTDNIILAAGKYDIYFKANDGMMWIQFSAETPTDVEDAAAELIYAIDGTIFAPAPFAIIDLSGKDVTNSNGSLQGTYIVKTQNSATKISVK